MKTVKIVSIAALFAFAGSIQAAGVGGSVDTNVTTGDITQTNEGGFGNVNEANVGGVGTLGIVGGSVSTNVTTGDITQSNEGGSLNKNKINIGGVE
jgi:hypothetical protein